MAGTQVVSADMENPFPNASFELYTGASQQMCVVEGEVMNRESQSKSVGNM